MEKNLLGEKIRTLRIGKGYSQDHLSALAQLSLRTVQRVENGETEPRGDTLNRLAKALEIGIDELIGGAKMSDTGTNFLILVTLSGLACICDDKIPFVGLALPLIIWYLKKGINEETNGQVKKFLNFQITWEIVHTCFLLIIILMSVMPLANSEFGFNFFQCLALLHPLIIGYNAAMIIFNVIRILMGRDVKFWPKFNFLK